MAMVAGIWTLHGYGQWAVEVKASGEFIGRAGVWFPEGFPEIEAGWVIGREHWGSGFATEAGREALRQAFATLGVDARDQPHRAGQRRVAAGGGEARRRGREDRDVPRSRNAVLRVHRAEAMTLEHVRSLISTHMEVKRRAVAESTSR